MFSGLIRMKTMGRYADIGGGEKNSGTRQIIVLAAAALLGSILQASVAIPAGVVAGSVALVAFGAMSAVETVPASVFLVAAIRLHRGRRAERSHAALQRSADFVAGVAFILLALAVVHDAGSRLFYREESSTSVIGIVLAALSLILTPLLVVLTGRSGALPGGQKGELWMAAVSALPSFLLLCGLVSAAVINWWWADPAAALLMLPLMLRTGWRSVGESREYAPSPSQASRKERTER